MIGFRRASIGVVVVTLVGALTAIGASGVTPAQAAPAAAAPACTFNGSSLPLILSSTPGEKIALNCTGLSQSHPYLVMEVSLLLGIDPKAAPLLSGNITSLPALLAVIAALPEINPAAVALPFTDSSGRLKYTYTLPTSQAPDPNATCPPSKAELNMGLIGCAIATIDLTTFKVVAPGSALVNYKGQPVFPPAPTVALSTTTAKPGQVVHVSDAPGATTFWWMATLGKLAGLLGGGAAPPPVVTVTLKGTTGPAKSAANKITVTPAVYNFPTLTPPKMSGEFTVPAVRGLEKVTVTYAGSLLGLTVYNIASAPTRLNVP